MNTNETMTALTAGGARIWCLSTKGRPTMVERAKILPPESRTGAIIPEERQAVMRTSRLAGRYDQVIDRESAYELLAAKYEQARQEDETAKQAKEAEKEAREEARRARQADQEARRRAKDNPITSIVNDVTKQASRTLGREVGRTIIRGILGGLFGKKK